MWTFLLFMLVQSHLFYYNALIYDFFIGLFKLEYSCQCMGNFVCMFVAHCSEQKDLGFRGISKRSMVIKIINDLVTPNYV